MKRKNLIQELSVATVLLMAMMSSGAQAQTETLDVSENLFVEQGGYTKIKVDTNLEQKYPLLQVKSFELPASIKYVGQSLNYILSMSGYSLAPLIETDAAVLNLYSLKLPLTNKAFTSSTTLQIVQTIVGVGFDVSVSEVDRTITVLPRKPKS